MKNGLIESSLDELLCLVATWGREQLEAAFRTQQHRFPVDFTSEFYQSQTVDRLRHIYVALYLQNNRPTRIASAMMVA